METLGYVVGSKIKAKWKVLVTDSCHSGAITPDADAQRAQPRACWICRARMFSLTASRDRERSFESQDWGGGHGIFTYYVVKGLEGAADETAMASSPPTSSPITSAATSAKPPRASRIPPPIAAASIPTCCWRTCPRPARSRMRRRPSDGTLIFETNMDGVEVFVDGKSRKASSTRALRCACRACARATTPSRA